MNDLYGQTCSCCHSVHPRNEASVSASFTPELMARLLADIYAKTFNVEEDIYSELYEAARDTFERALQEGYPIEDVDDADTLFRQALKDDTDVFAAFRTHRMQNDIASQLLDENGKLKELGASRKMLSLSSAPTTTTGYVQNTTQPYSVPAMPPTGNVSHVMPTSCPT